MEKLSLDLSMGLTEIKNSLKNDSTVTPTASNEDVVIIESTMSNDTNVKPNSKLKPHEKPQTREYNHKPKTTSNKTLFNKTHHPDDTNQKASCQKRVSYSQKAATKPNANAKTQQISHTPDVIFISDSNGFDIDASRLKPGEKVLKQIRYTFEQATSLVPQTSEPEKVKDIVFQVGLNHTHNIHNDERTIEEIQDDIQSRTLTMQTKYLKQFPNARQHIVAMPPMTKEHEKINESLGSLCKFTGSQFVSHKAFLYNNTKKLRANTMKQKYGKIDYPYNDLGVKTLAKGIIKSLFSKENRDNNQLSIYS